MKTHRLFFALWPSDQVRHSIVETFSQLPPPRKGRLVQAHNLHITLHFIGPVTGDIKDCMLAAAKSVKSNPFELNLDTLGTFRRAGIVWMGSRDTPDELVKLNKSLGNAIHNCGYKLDNRAYLPHLTLMRKCTAAVSTRVDFSIPWLIKEFVLVESVTFQEAVNYQVIEKYPLS